MSITVEELQKQVHNLAREKGWWPLGQEKTFDFDTQTLSKGPEEIAFGAVNIPEKLMLMVSELGEALEWYRNPDIDPTLDLVYTNENPDKPDGMWIELADCIIRILDLAGAYNINMEELIKLKHTYNRTRPYQHGGKKC